MHARSTPPPDHRFQQLETRHKCLATWIFKILNIPTDTSWLLVVTMGYKTERTLRICTCQQKCRGLTVYGVA